MQSVEEMTDAAIARLIAKLDGELTAMETRYAGDPIRDIGALPRPRATPTQANPNPTGDYYAGGCGQVTRYPTVEVAIPDLSGDNFSIGMHESDTVPVLVARAWLQHARVNVLYRQCCRYGAAIFNALAAPDELTGLGSGFGEDVSVTRYMARWRYNPETNTKDEVQSAALVIFYLDAPDVRP